MPSLHINLSDFVFATLSLYFAFFLVNYAEIFAGIREWVFPRLWSKAVYVLGCPICFAFWSLVALSLFVGFTPLIFCVPPATLFLDLIFNKLRDGCKDEDKSDEE